MAVRVGESVQLPDGRTVIAPPPPRQDASPAGDTTPAEPVSPSTPASTETPVVQADSGPAVTADISEAGRQLPADLQAAQDAWRGSEYRGSVGLIHQVLSRRPGMTLQAGDWRIVQEGGQLVAINNRGERVTGDDNVRLVLYSVFGRSGDRSGSVFRGLRTMDRELTADSSEGVWQGRQGPIVIDLVRTVASRGQVYAYGNANDYYGSGGGISIPTRVGNAEYYVAQGKVDHAIDLYERALNHTVPGSTEQRWILDRLAVLRDAQESGTRVACIIDAMGPNQHEGEIPTQAVAEATPAPQPETPPETVAVTPPPPPPAEPTPPPTVVVAPPPPAAPALAQPPVQPPATPTTVVAENRPPRYQYPLDPMDDPAYWTQPAPAAQPPAEATPAEPTAVAAAPEPTPAPQFTFTDDLIEGDLLRPDSSARPGRPTVSIIDPNRRPAPGYYGTPIVTPSGAVIAADVPPPVIPVVSVPAVVEPAEQETPVVAVAPEAAPAEPAPTTPGTTGTPPAAQVPTALRDAGSILTSGRPGAAGEASDALYDNLPPNGQLSVVQISPYTTVLSHIPDVSGFVPGSIASQFGTEFNRQLTALGTAMQSGDQQAADTALRNLEALTDLYEAAYGQYGGGSEQLWGRASRSESDEASAVSRLSTAVDAYRQATGQEPPAFVAARLAEMQGVYGQRTAAAAGAETQARDGAVALLTGEGSATDRAQNASQILSDLASDHSVYTYSNIVAGLRSIAYVSNPVLLNLLSTQLVALGTAMKDGNQAGIDAALAELGAIAEASRYLTSTDNAPRTAQGNPTSIEATWSRAVGTPGFEDDAATLALYQAAAQNNTLSVAARGYLQQVYQARYADLEGPQGRRQAAADATRTAAEAETQALATARQRAHAAHDELQSFIDSYPGAFDQGFMGRFTMIGRDIDTMSVEDLNANARRMEKALAYARAVLPAAGSSATSAAGQTGGGSSGSAVVLTRDFLTSDSLFLNAQLNPTSQRRYEISFDNVIPEVQGACLRWGAAHNSLPNATARLEYNPATGQFRISLPVTEQQYNANGTYRGLGTVYRVQNDFALYVIPVPNLSLPGNFTDADGDGWYTYNQPLSLSQ